MSYAVLIKRKGFAAELTLGTYKTKSKAIEARKKAIQYHPARIVRVTPNTYPVDVNVR